MSYFFDLIKKENAFILILAVSYERKYEIKMKVLLISQGILQMENDKI